jgi:outer membrane protein assembly factor BamA
MTRPGAPLQFSRLIDDLERLFNTGLFEDVNYRLDALGGDSADVIIEVQERAYGFYSVGIRYDNADNLVFGFEVGQGNLGGSGASVRAAFDLGKPNEARLGLTGTTLFQLPVGYRLDGFLGSVDRSYYELSQSLGDYRVSYRGGVAEAGYILGRDAFFDFGLNGYWAAYRVPDELPRSESLHADQPEWIAGPTFRLEVNTFRDVNFPTAGVVSKIEVLSSITAMKATRQFVKFVCSDERILPVSSRLLFRPALDLGLSLPRGQLALAEQFRTGGAGFVGFASDHFTSPQRAVVRVGMDFKFFRLFGQED